MQQQALLPPKNPPKNVLLETQTKKSELLPKCEDKSNSPMKSISKKSESVLDEGSQPGYARPKRLVRRGRSRTPPPSRAKTPVRRSTKSPLRSRTKSPAPVIKRDPPNTLRSKLSGSQRNDEKNEKKRIILSPNSQKRSDRQNRPSFQGLSVIDGRRKQRSVYFIST